MVMIESGFAPNAISHANAVGPWQFIEPTGARYGLEKNWWLDERRDLKKSTSAAINWTRCPSESVNDRAIFKLTRLEYR